MNGPDSIPVALTIGGSDPSGGAGLQADLKTFHQHGVFGMSVVSLLTVQNTCEVAAVQALEPDFVIAQLDACLTDIPPAVIKVGALGSAEIIEAVAARLAEVEQPIVIDPVMVSKHGHSLMDEPVRAVLRDRLLGCALVVTPNLHEAQSLSGLRIESYDDALRAARTIAAAGPRHVLIKCGGLSTTSLDLLWTDGQVHEFPAERIPSSRTHGTGCVLSAAITARLARGEDIVAAVAAAKSFVSRAIRSAPELGRGVGPTNMLTPVELADAAP